MLEKKSKIRKAAEAYISASFYFRFGPDRFSARTQIEFLQAERNLFEATTGERDLVAASKVLGIDYEEEQREHKKAIAKAQKEFSKETEKLRKSKSSVTTISLPTPKKKVAVEKPRKKVRGFFS